MIGGGQWDFGVSLQVLGKRSLKSRDLKRSLLQRSSVKIATGISPLEFAKNIGNFVAGLKM